MKKIITVSLILTIIILVFLIIFDKSKVIEVEFVDELDTSYNETIKVCVMKRSGKLVYVDVKKHNDENIYVYVLKLYDHYRNNLPLDYISPLNGNFEVKKLDKRGNTLKIELELIYLNDNFNKFLKCLMWTYQGMNIEKIEVHVAGEVIVLEKSNDYLENSG